VAPRYYYRYRLRVGPDRVAHYTFFPGYDETGPAWTSDFQVSAAALDSLWMEFQVGALGDSPRAPDIDPGERRIGGGSQSLTVVASGASKTFESERNDAWAMRIEQFKDHVGRLTPDSVHARLRIRHAEWAARTFGPQDP
jgi:hypothetical protein